MTLDERQALTQIEASRLALFVVDGGQLAYVNGAMATLVGVPPSALAGRPPSPDILEADDWRRLEAGVARAIAEPIRWITVRGHDGRGGGWAAEAMALATSWQGRPATLVQLVPWGRDVEGDAWRHAQTAEAVARLAAVLAHDLGNALAAIRANAELITEETGVGASPDVEVGEILAATDRAAALGRQLAAFGRKAGVWTAVLPARTLVHGAVALAAPFMSPSIQVSVTAGEAVPPVHVDPAALEQALLHILLNARDAMPEGGRLDLTIGAVSLEGRPAVDLIIHDTGGGMSEETLARAFEPFFTTRADHLAAGLGLPVAQAILRQAGGIITVASAPGTGTTVRVRLPAAREVS